MAKLDFKKENAYFELEVGDEIYTGTLNDLTKQQKAKQDKALNPFREKNDEIAKKLKKAERLQTKLKTKTHLQDWEAVDQIESEIFALQDEISVDNDWIRDNYKPEPMFKERLVMSVESDDIEEILKAGEEHGYENVLNTIIRDIKERNEKK